MLKFLRISCLEISCSHMRSCCAEDFNVKPTVRLARHTQWRHWLLVHLLFQCQCEYAVEVWNNLACSMGYSIMNQTSRGGLTESVWQQNLSAHAGISRRTGTREFSEVNIYWHVFQHAESWRKEDFGRNIVDQANWYHTGTELQKKLLIVFLFFVSAQNCSIRM